MSTWQTGATSYSKISAHNFFSTLVKTNPLPLVPLMALQFLYNRLIAIYSDGGVLSQTSNQPGRKVGRQVFKQATDGRVDKQNKKLLCIH